jgi:hypothetical protein
MKYRLLRPALTSFVIAFLILACGSLSVPGSGNGGSSTSSAQSNQPTQGSASSAGGKYFQEDFNNSMDGWSHFVVNGKNYEVLGSDPGDMKLGVQDGFLLFDLQGKGEWVYAIYDTQQYDDVRIDVSAENRGTNDNNISLVCRYTSDGGWYEFNVANSGLYNIYYAHETPDNKIGYSLIADGGSNKIKQGKNTNLYSVICQGHTLTLYINNIKTRQIDDNQYVLRSGKVGLSVSSFTDPPATVGFDWIKLSQP